jgi:hypothetical protein
MFAAIDCWQEEATEVLTAKLRELVDRKDKLNADSPQIPRWAYLEGKRGIEEGEASFKVDKDPPKVG